LCLEHLNASLIMDFLAHLEGRVPIFPVRLPAEQGVK